MVAEADAEGRCVGRDDFLDRFDGVVARFRIPRAVRQKYAVRFERKNARGGCLCRDDREAAAALGQHAQDVIFYAVVIGDHMERGVVSGWPRARSWPWARGWPWAIGFEAGT